MALNRDSILAATSKITAFDVPEWGGQVNLKPLSVGQLMEFLKAREHLDSAELFPLIVTLSACDDEGTPLFTRDDIEALKAKDFDVLKRIGEAAIKLNKLGPDDDEEAAKNSPSIRSA
jgi:hypothetical protein